MLAFYKKSSFSLFITVFFLALGLQAQRTVGRKFNFRDRNGG